MILFRRHYMTTVIVSCNYNSYNDNALSCLFCILGLHASV